MEWLANVIHYLHIQDVLDIGIMAFLIYKILGLARSTRAINLIKGVGLFLVALWLSSALDLHGINFILSHLVEWGVLALIILFQPEIRKGLERAGAQRFKWLQPFTHSEPVSETESAIMQTVMACTSMSESRTGALIVFEREMRLNDLARSGTFLDANVTSELIKNIFFVKAPMHDGALIVRNGRCLAAGCMLPLSPNVNLSRDLGMRHRAGIGMSEAADSVVVVVSEETGGISVAIGGMLKRHLNPDTLERILRNELLPPDEKEGEKTKGLWTFLPFARKENDHAEN